MSNAIIGTNDEYVTTMVITNRGVVPINEINIGDYVYEFNTGRKLMVKGLEQSDLEPAYRVIYNDGRSKLFLESQMMYTGNGICTTLDALKLKPEEFGSINPKRIEFDHNPIIEGLDPYTMGMLYLYGDLTDKYVNLPITIKEASRMLMDRYTFVNFGGSICDKCYFRYPNSDENITWGELIKAASMEDLLNLMKDIPYEYMYTSAKNRIQFISGIFDCGFDYVYSYNKNICIVASDNNKLLQIQRMLLSLGVLSSVNYSKSVGTLAGRDFMLTILPSKENDGYPKFLYNIDKISRFIMEDNMMDSAHITNFEVKPRFFKLVPNKKMWAYNLVLEEPHALFITKTYIPHVSC